MMPLLRKAVEEGVYKIHKKIDADNNAYRATRLARHISSRAEALHMVLAWAFHEIELEKEAFNYMREHALDELKKGIIR